METLKLNPTSEDIRVAGELIRNGKLVAFPTETVYGLGADALNEEAVKSIYEAKGRPSDNPMIVHIGEKEQLNTVADGITESVSGIIEAFWPGPLTVVLAKREIIPHTTTGGLETVAVRMPSSETARNLINESGRPIAAPSANISGRPSPTTWQDVLEDMDGRIDAIIMGEDCKVGIESTVLDLTGEVPVILRPGYVTPGMIKEATGIDVKYDKSLTSAPVEVLDPADGPAQIDNFRPKSPGMKYKHYSPKAKVILVNGDIEEARAEEESKGHKTAVLNYGTDSEEAAHRFFADLRRLDREQIEIILVATLKEEELGFSIMNRMLKSAGYEVISR